MSFPGKYDFNYYRGDTFSFVIKPKDFSANPFNLNGYSATFVISDKRGPNRSIAYNATSTVNPVSNIVSCTISPSIGRNLSPDTLWLYDVQITNGSTVYTLLTGSITSTNDISGAV